MANMRPKMMVDRGFCPACGHRLAVHDRTDGCLAGDNGGTCWCPLALAAGVVSSPAATDDNEGGVR